MHTQDDEETNHFVNFQHRKQQIKRLATINISRMRWDTSSQLPLPCLHVLTSMTYFR